MALVLAPLSALVTGLLFGLHPAMRAAALDPAVALREV
jgi:ABC-type lipoprotein release transport system permease subunit